MRRAERVQGVLLIDRADFTLDKPVLSSTTRGEVGQGFSAIGEQRGCKAAGGLIDQILKARKLRSKN
jgi:hypothetical protein